jgi:hypothetical protein
VASLERDIIQIPPFFEQGAGDAAIAAPKPL